MLNLAPLYIFALLISYPAYILMIPTQALINGVGFANFTLVVGLLDGFVFRIGLSYLLGKVCGLGMQGLFLGYFLAAYASAIPNTAYYLSGLWKRRRLLVK